MTIGRGPKPHAFLPFGASPHVVPREEMSFNPETGGWQSTSALHGSHRVGQPPMPSSPPQSRIPRAREKAIESKAERHIHHGNFMLDQAKEVSLGILPPDWSVTSKMEDTRPNGRAQFDARFIEAPVGRARGGRSMEWTPVGTADSGSTVRAKDLDFAMAKAREVDELGVELDVENGKMAFWDAMKARDREMTDMDNPEMYMHDSFVDGQTGPSNTEIYGLRPGEGYEIDKETKYTAGFGRAKNTGKIVNSMFAGVGKQELFHGHQAGVGDAMKKSGVGGIADAYGGGMAGITKVKKEDQVTTKPVKSYQLPSESKPWEVSKPKARNTPY